MIKYRIDLPLDSPERTMLHGELIRKKRLLRQLYQEWYAVFTKEMKDLPEGILVELGAGGGFLKEIHPSVICSDIIALPSNDMTFSALDMPFDDNSVAGLLMIDTFHHIPDAKRFLIEANRVLIPNGKIIMIEPANSWWGRFIYTYFHHEPFNPAGSWSIPTTGPLTGANGALPWIVFIRDRKRFQKEFPELTIESITYRNPICYILSGGVSRKQMIPDMLVPMVKAVDRCLSLLNKNLSMFMVIIVQKGPIKTDAWDGPT